MAADGRPSAAQRRAPPRHFVLDEQMGLAVVAGDSPPYRRRSGLDLEQRTISHSVDAGSMRDS
jgi:hypothetical protein